MSDGAATDEGRQLAASIAASVLVAISLVLGYMVWHVRGDLLATYKEMGVQLPGITVLAMKPLVLLIAVGLLAGAAGMIAIQGLRVIGMSTWVILLFLFAGFWSLSFYLPWHKLHEQLGKSVVGVVRS